MLLYTPHLGHYNDIMMSAMASQITSLTIVYFAIVYAQNKRRDQRKHRSSASLAFVRGIHWWPVNSSHKGPVTRKMFWWRRDVMMLGCSRNAWRSRSYMFLVAASEVVWVRWHLISPALPPLVWPCYSTDYSGSQRKFIYSFYLRPDDAYQWWTGSLLIHVLTWRLFGAKP